MQSGIGSAVRMEDIFLVRYSHKEGLNIPFQASNDNNCELFWLGEEVLLQGIYTLRNTMMSEYTVYLPEKRYPSDGIGYLSAHASSAQVTQLSMGVIHLHAAKEKIKIHSFAHGARQHVNPNSNHEITLAP